MSNELVKLANKDGKVVVSSRVVAEDFGKQHKDVLKVINNTFSSELDRAQFCDLFIESEYKASNGKMNKEYLLTRDGFSLLVMGFTGPQALKWKLKYIEAFNQMEEQLKTIAIQSPKAFVDSLALTEHSISKYLPNFLTWKNIDEVMPLLIDRVTKSVDKGDIKLGVLSTTINIAKSIRNSYPNSAEKEIMTRYIEDAQEKYDRVLIASKAGTTASNNRLQKRVNELLNERFAQQDFIDYVNNFLNKADYGLLASSLDEYVGFIAKNKFNGNFKEANNYIYGIFKYEKGIDIHKISKEKQKELGATSKREAIYLMSPDYLEYILLIALDEAKKLGFQF